MHPLIYVPRRSLVVPDRAPRARLGCGCGTSKSGSPSPWTPAALGADLWGYGTPASLVNSAGVAGEWTDLSGLGHSPVAAGAARPVYAATGNPLGGPCASFDGAAHYMRATAALADPVHILLAVRAKGGGAALGETIVDGIGYNTIRAFIKDTGEVDTYSGAFGPIKIVAMNTWMIMDFVFAVGVNAGKFGTNGGAQTLGTFGNPITDPGGITLGAAGGVVGEWGNVDIAAWMVAKRDLAADRANAVAWMRAVTGV